MAQGKEDAFMAMRLLIFVLVTSSVTSCAHGVNRSQKTENAPVRELAADTMKVPTQKFLPTKEQVGSTADYHFTMAQAYSTEGNPDRAIEEYKLALIYDQNSSIIRTRLATEYIKKGLLSAAIEVCQEAILKEPNSVDAHFLLASFYSSTQQHDQAIMHYDHVLRVNSKHEEAAVYKAQSQIEMGCSKCAVKSLKTFLSNNNDSTIGWYYLGRAYHKGEDYHQAEMAYQRAIKSKDSLTQASLALGFLYEEQKKTAKAISIYESLYDQYQNLTAASRLSTIYLKNEQYKKAIPYLEAIQSLDPEDMNAQVKLGLVYMELKSWEKAVQVFKKLLANSPESDRVRFYLGNLFEEMGKNSEAITEFKNIPNQSKLYVDATLHISNIYKTTGSIELAKTHIKDAIVQSPKSVQFYIYLASLEEESEDYLSVIATLERAYKVFPDDEKVLYYLGSMYDKMGETTKSIAKMEQLVFLNPKNPDALNYLGYTWSVARVNLDQAEKYLKLALSIKPNNPYILDSWGWHLFLSGKTKDSIKILEKAASLKSDEPAILEHLGDAYMKANLQEKALLAYQKASSYLEDEQQKQKVALKIDGLRSILVQNGRIKTPNQTRAPASSNP